jgi:hypothetical protein
MCTLIKKFSIAQLSFPVLIALSLAGCSKEQPAAQHEVVVYTSLDKVFSQPILEEFERKTGIGVKAVYDSEATKTTGLVNRLIAAYPKSIFSGHTQSMLDSLPTAETRK